MPFMVPEEGSEAFLEQLKFLDWGMPIGSRDIGPDIMGLSGDRSPFG